METKPNVENKCANELKTLTGGISNSIVLEREILYFKRCLEDTCDDFPALQSLLFQFPVTLD